MKEFKKELFRIALEKERAKRYQKQLENSRKQEETKGYTKRAKFESHRMISLETEVNEATVRNIFAGKYTAGIEPLKALSDWANVKLDNFF